jgi:lysophospholipase L1-like esterase
VEDNQEIIRGNWFQKNPRKTLVCLTLVLVFFSLMATEKILKYINEKNGIFLDTEQRYIRIKEYRPLTKMVVSFPRDYLKFTDNVSTKRCRVEIDSNGFIIPSNKYETPDCSIVFLGGSTTECMYNDEENRFPYLVGNILEKETRKKINSYNGGVSGCNTLLAIDVLINKVVPIGPKIVVFMENINDITTLIYEGTYWNSSSARSPLETQNKTKMLGKLLKEIFIPNLNKAYRDFKKVAFHKEDDEFASARGKKLKINQPALVHEYEMNLQTIVYICKARGIVPVLMTQANRVKDNPDRAIITFIESHAHKSGINYTDIKELYNAFNETIRSVGEKNNVLVIDLAKEIPQDKNYLYDIVHFTDDGSKYAAEIIAAKLKKIVEQ